MRDIELILINDQQSIEDFDISNELRKQHGVKQSLYIKKILVDCANVANLFNHPLYLNGVEYMLRGYVPEEGTHSENNTAVIDFNAILDLEKRNMMKVYGTTTLSLTIITRKKLNRFHRFFKI